MSFKSIGSLAALAGLTIVVGCRSASSDTTGVQINLALDPSPPVVGNANVTLTLASKDGEPLTGAEVQLEGNMNHAGMKPSFADLKEVEPGRYTGALSFTMGGDWFILISAKTRDGKNVQRKIDVPGVKRL